MTKHAIGSSQAAQAGQEAEFAANSKIAEAQRDYQTNVAQYQAVVNQRKAEADLAYDLQKFKTGQLVKAEEVQVQIIEKQKQIELQQQEIMRKQRELEANVQKPADAERYKVETLANATADYNVVAGTVQGRPGVDNIVNVQSILSNFYKLLNGARDAVIITAIILVIAAILLVANTIRLSAFNRRRETSIMRLVGASNFYVQLPFLLEGVIAGLIGWVIAAALLVAVKTMGLDALQQYFPYNVQLSLADLIEVIVLAMVMGVLLCGVTSFLTLRRYLRV